MDSIETLPFPYGWEIPMENWNDPDSCIGPECNPPFVFAIIVEFILSIVKILHSWNVVPRMCDLLIKGKTIGIFFCHKSTCLAEKFGSASCTFVPSRWFSRVSPWGTAWQPRIWSCWCKMTRAQPEPLQNMSFLCIHHEITGHWYDEMKVSTNGKL